MYVIILIFIKYENAVQETLEIARDVARKSLEAQLP